MNDKLKKVMDDDLSIIELDNRCDMSIIDPTLGLVLFNLPSINNGTCNTCNTVAGC